jgi:hypothetical protein
MKKFIVILAMVFSATICQADIIQDIFKNTNTVDVTTYQKNAEGKQYGITILSTSEFKQKTNDFIQENSSYMIFKNWEPVNNSYCISFFGQSKIYALCIEGITVVAGEIK